MKKVAICADDYGQNPAISSGIRQLIDKNRITATSCMVNTDYWSEQGKALLPYQNKIDIGLHLNLTEGRSLSGLFPPKNQLPSLKKIILNSYARKISLKMLEDELTAQLERFSAVLGKPPGFIDGHQHVHHLPVVRQALLNCYQKNNFGKYPVYIRSVAIHSWPHTLHGNFIKQCIIHFTGAGSLQKQLQQLGIPYNQHFSGIYDFAYAKNYPQLFRQFLHRAHDKTLIMCHPAEKSSRAYADPIANSRIHELSYFASQQFIHDCDHFTIQLSRFQDIV